MIFYFVISSISAIIFHAAISNDEITPFEEKDLKMGAESAEGLGKNFTASMSVTDGHSVNSNGKQRVSLTAENNQRSPSASYDKQQSPSASYDKQQSPSASYDEQQRATSYDDEQTASTSYAHHISYSDQISYDDQQKTSDDNQRRELTVKLVRNSDIDKDSYISDENRSPSLDLDEDQLQQHEVQQIDVAYDDNHQAYFTYDENQLPISDRIAQLKEKVATTNCTQKIDTILHVACRLCNTPLVRILLLLNHPTEIINESGNTPLLVAILNSCENAAISLLKGGANVNAVDFESDTALHNAARQCQPSIVAALLRRDANMEAQNNWGSTPLGVAISNGCESAASILINEGADITAQDYMYDTPLRLAIKGCYPNLTKLLCDNGADANCKNRFGVSPMNEAITLGYECIVEVLLQEGADINEIVDENTFLHMAVRGNHEGIVHLLVQHGCPVNTENHLGYTALHLAMRSKNLSIVMELVEQGGANVNAAKCDMGTPLHFFIPTDAGDLVILEYLLLKGANLEARNRYLETPLKMSLRYENVYKIRALLENGADFSHIAIEQIHRCLWGKKRVCRGKRIYENPDKFMLRCAKTYVKNLFRTDLTLKNLTEIYNKNGVFAANRIQRACIQRSKNRDLLGRKSKLEFTKSTIFAVICAKVSQMTFTQSLPQDILGDVLSSAGYWGWKAERLAWNLALASKKLHVPVQDQRITAVLDDLIRDWFQDRS